MDRVAVFVDAGYLYAGGARSVTGIDGTKRHEMTLNIPVAIPYLIAKAEALSQQKLLRIYWYDGAPSSRPTTDHQILASTDNVKLRLGVINGFGQQKGVDGKIITDLTELSRNRAFTDAVLLGGDEDLRIGVELAQEYGARVHLVTIEGASSSPNLRQESDTLTVLSRADLNTFMTVRHVVTYRVAPAIPDPSAMAVSVDGSLSTASVVDVQKAESKDATAITSGLDQNPLAVPKAFDTVARDEVKEYLVALSSTEQVSLTTALKTGTGVPTEHDGRLLARTRKALGRDLDPAERAKLRRILKTELEI